MAKKTYKANLFSVSSLKELKKDLEQYRDSLSDKCRLISERCAAEGVQIAKINIVSMDAIFTSELLNSIDSKMVSSNKQETVYSVFSASDHAVFVEFGTGIVGKSSPYPYPLPDGVTWEYATGKTIRQLADGRYGWFYPADDGNWYFTEGMESRPFMYETAIELRAKTIYKIVKEVFK